MGNKSSSNATHDSKFKAINPELSISNQSKSLPSPSDEKRLGRSLKDTPMESNEVAARLSPTPPTSGPPRSFVSPRGEMLGNVSNIDRQVVSNSPTSSDKEPFDHRLTEGQSRRNAMADCESECSEVTEYLYLGGHKVHLATYNM